MVLISIVEYADESPCLSTSASVS